MLAMVTLQELQALDLVLWLQTGERAAELAITTQSTISRRSRATLEQFGLRLQRTPDGWRASGDHQLVGMERQLHQRARLSGRQPLRLQVPFWTRCATLRQLPEGWCANPPASALVCNNPVELLRQRVIDACLLTSCQLPTETDDLLLLELYGRPIELTLFPRRAAADAKQDFQRQREGGTLHLEHMPFLPRSCCDNAVSLFSQLTAEASGPARSADRHSPPPEPEQFSIAFLTAEMREAQHKPWTVDAGFDPYPYVERLAVLAEHAREPAVQRLQEVLLERFAPLNT